MSLERQSIPFVHETMRWPLSTKMIVAFLVTIIVPTLGLTIFLFNFQRNQFRHQAEDHALTVGQLKVQEMQSAAKNLGLAAEDLVLRTENTEIYLAALSQDATEEDIAAVNQVLEDLWQDKVSIVFVRLVSVQPDTIASQGLTNIETNRITQGDISRAITETRISAIYAGPDGQPLVDIVIPFEDLQGRVLGHFVITQDLNRTVRQPELDPLPDLYTVLSRQPSVQDLPRANIMLFDDQGTLIGTNTRRDRLFQNEFSNSIPLVRTEQASPNDINRYGIALRTFGGQVDTYTSDVTGERVIGYYERIGDTRWTIAVEIPEEEVFSLVNREFLPVVIGAAALAIIASSIIYLAGYRVVAPVLNRLAEAMSTFSFQNPTTYEPSSQEDEVGKVDRAYTRLVNYVHEEYQARTVKSSKRQQRLQLMHDLTNVMKVNDMEFLVSETVRLIHERETLIDHAQIFLLDDRSNHAVLRAATGELGRRLMIQEYEQSLADGGIIGNTILFDNTTVVNNVERSAEYFMSATFKQTRSVLAVPIKAHDEVIGVLDLHSYTPDAFSDSDIDFFVTIASSLGLFLLSSQVTVDKPDTAVIITGDRVTQVGQQAIEATAGGLITTGDSWTPLQLNAMRLRRIVSEKEGDKVYFALPVILRNEVLGAVEWTVTTAQYDSDLVQTANELVRRLALAIDNAQLFEQSQRLIERERRVNEITRKITAENDIQQILQVAVRELGQALGTPETVIRLNIERESFE